MQAIKKCATARIWTYVRDGRPWASGDPPAAWYKFSTDRQGKHPTDHLSRYKGWIHADGHLSRFTPKCNVITPLRPLRARKGHTLQPPS
ncbi:MAG: transposase [Paracoccaceae bacterium]|nr:transposase [Paracoccaceae bacterium]